MDDPPATYELSFRLREGYLHTLIRSDTMTTEMAMEYLGRVAEKCDELCRERLLLERLRQHIAVVVCRPVGVIEIERARRVLRHATADFCYLVKSASARNCNHQSLQAS
jgi:hypothetical protein